MTRLEKRSEVSVSLWIELSRRKHRKPCMKSVTTFGSFNYSPKKENHNGEIKFIFTALKSDTDPSSSFPPHLQNSQE